MSDLLFRFVGDEAGGVEWCNAEAGSARVERGSLDELATMAGGQRLVLVASGTALSVTTATVPSRQRATIQKALPYALEEQFADDVESMHFAIGERLPSGELGVVACRHVDLRSWLERCVAAGVTPAAVVAEPLLVPWQEGEWTVVGDGDHVLVRLGAWRAFGADRSALPVVMSQVAGVAGDWPLLRLFGDLEPEEVAGTEEREFLMPGERMPTLALLATQYRPGRTLDLLQGPYSPRALVGRYLKPWRLAAALLLALLVIQLGSLMLTRSRLQAESRRLAQESERIYREAFPDARAVVDARLQMERQLQALRQAVGSDGSGLLDLLERSGTILTSEQGLKLTGLNYRAGQLSLSISASSLATVDAVRQRLADAAGLAVEIQSASSRDGRVEGRLLIRNST